MSIGVALLALFGLGVLALLVARFAPRRENVERGKGDDDAVTAPTPDDDEPLASAWGDREAGEFAMLPEGARCDLIFSVESARDARSDALLTYALGDASEVVATAAAHALIARGERERVEGYLNEHHDERTTAMGATLQALFPDITLAVPPPALDIAAIDDVALYESSAAHPRNVRPVLLLEVDAVSLRAYARTIERADSGGMLRHIIALRRLFPNEAVNAAPVLAAALHDARDVMNAPIARLALTLNRPRPVVSSKDIEDGESRMALRSLLDALLSTPSSPEFPQDRSVRKLVGNVDLDALAKARVRLDLEPIGAALPWLVNALLLPTVLLDANSERDLLGAYRERAIESFSTLCELPVEEFHRVIATHSDRELDALLDAALPDLVGLDAIASGENSES